MNRKSFIRTAGVKATEVNSLQKSVDEKMIAQVIQRAAEFDMIISK